MELNSDTRMALVEKDISQIKNDVSSIKERLENGLLRRFDIVGNDVDWIKRFVFLLAVVSVSGLGSAVFAVLWRR